MGNRAPDPGAALLSPERAYAAIWRVVGLVANGIGSGWGAPYPLYYLFFVPLGALFRRGRADRLERFFEPRRRLTGSLARVETLSPSDRQF